MNSVEDLKNTITMKDQYRSNQNIFESEIPSRFIHDYCVAKSCESAQLILEVV